MYELQQIEFLINQYRDKLLQPEMEWPHDIQTGLDYINANLFDTEFTISAMKIACKISDQNFSSRFRNYVGYTPRDYIKTHRIEAAKRLLNQKSLARHPVNYLGFMVGYEKPSTFTMIFKKETGISPSLWKQKKLLESG